MKANWRLVGFWILVLTIPILILSAEFIDRHADATAAAKSKARTSARELLFEAQALIAPQRAIAGILEEFQKYAERTANLNINAGKAKSQILRKYRSSIEGFLPSHTILWMPNPLSNNHDQLRIMLKNGLEVPENLADDFLNYRFYGKADVEGLETLLSSATDSPMPLEYQNENTNGKFQIFSGVSKNRGLYWRVTAQSGLMALLDASTIDRKLGMKYAVSKLCKAGRNLIFTDPQKNIIFAGNKDGIEPAVIIKRLVALGKGKIPPIARVAGRLAITSSMSSGMPGYITVTVP